jgi:hypothetical protein
MMKQKTPFKNMPNLPAGRDPGPKTGQAEAHEDPTHDKTM